MIELHAHYGGYPILVNPAQITYVNKYRAEGKLFTAVSLSGGEETCFVVSEKYEDIKEMLENV